MSSTTMNQERSIGHAGREKAGALGPYRLLAEIGRGSMTTAFLARVCTDDQMSIDVVVKQLDLTRAKDHEFRARWIDEARIAARFQHPKVVKTLDVRAERSGCFVLTEFVDGQPLSRIRERARQSVVFPLSVHLRVIANVLSGLDYIHEMADAGGASLDLVHGDVRPSNVFVTYDGKVKLLDFGLARAAYPFSPAGLAILRHKLAYLSPEAARSEPLDRRSDIFAVGVMLWEVATGRRFWQAQDESSIYRRLAAGDLPFDRRSSQIADPDLAPIAAHALAADRSDRYATAAEMKSAIDELLIKLARQGQAPALRARMETFFAVERENFQQTIARGLPPPGRPVPSSDAASAHAKAVHGKRVISVPPPPMPAATSRSTPIARPTPLSRSKSDGIDPNESVPPSTLNFDTAPTINLSYRNNKAVSSATSRPARIVYWGVIVAACLGGLAFVVSARRGLNAADQQGAASPMEGPVAGVSPPSVTAAVTNDSELPPITVVLRARPADARFSLDGEPLDGNPVTLRRTPDDKPHRIGITASGYVSAMGIMDFRRDLTLDFDLLRLPLRASGPSKANILQSHPKRTLVSDELPKSRRQMRSLDPEDPWRE